MNVKSKTVGYLLAFFFGGLGIHAFYYKKYVRGVLYLVFCWTYIPIFFSWIDLFFIKKWHEQLSNQEDAIKTNNLIKFEQNQETKKETRRKEKEYIPHKNTFKKSLSFYNEDDIILSDYKHIQTPKEITDSINFIRNPKKNMHSKNGISIEFTFSHSSDGFVKDSLRFSKERGKECKEIPLHAYWTTFEKLNSKQRKWYFYWRELVLNGRYPDVDLSYIILFIYELMNYSFNQSAAFNISMMVRLHEEYSERIPKLTNYSVQWIADMLHEVKQPELAKKWVPERTQYPPLYQQMLNNKHDLSKISITYWRPFLRNHRETGFFTGNKNKIYKVFKESIPLLKAVYEEEGIQLIDRWFQIKEEREIRHLFVSAVMGRSYNAVHEYVERIKPTEELFNEVTTLFKLSENITRFLNGEKREIKVEEEYVPEGFKVIMLERFLKPAKDVHKRFKVVQQSDQVELGADIPHPPTEEKKEETKKPLIEFDKEKISKLQLDTEGLIKTINARSEVEQDYDNTSSFELNRVEEKEDLEKTITIPDITKIQASSKVDVFSALGGMGGNVEGEEKFKEALSNIEKDFLLQFKDGQLAQDKANQIIKHKGIMLGAFLSELNEKANEYLGDNLLEKQEDTIVIYEEYENVLSTIKEYA